VRRMPLRSPRSGWRLPQIVPITKRPLILGHEIAGRVVEKGSGGYGFGFGRQSGRSVDSLDLRECGFCRKVMKTFAQTEKLPE